MFNGIIDWLHSTAMPIICASRSRKLWIKINGLILSYWNFCGTIIVFVISVRAQQKTLFLYHVSLCLRIISQSILRHRPGKFEWCHKAGDHDLRTRVSYWYEPVKLPFITLYWLYDTWQNVAIVESTLANLLFAALPSSNVIQRKEISNYYFLIKQIIICSGQRRIK